MCEVCFETAGDDIRESVTQEVAGDHIVSAKALKLFLRKYRNIAILKINRDSVIVVKQCLTNVNR